MQHLKGFKQLGRNNSHRKALYRNMAEALFKNERIRTTTVKAKEIRRIVEKMITRAKEKTLHNIRIINKVIKDKAILSKLFDEIAPRYVERNGGYTRIIKLSRRKGDGAEMAFLELIEEQTVGKKKKKKKKKINKENIVQDKKKTTKKEDKAEKKDEKVKEETEKTIIEDKKESDTTIIEDKKESDTTIIQDSEKEDGKE